MPLNTKRAPSSGTFIYYLPWKRHSFSRFLHYSSLSSSLSPLFPWLLNCHSTPHPASSNPGHPLSSFSASHFSRRVYSLSCYIFLDSLNKLCINSNLSYLCIFILLLTRYFNTSIWNAPMIMFQSEIDLNYYLIKVFVGFLLLLFFPLCSIW